MEPTFIQGERVLVVKRSYVSTKPGDVVIVHDPRTKKPIIKRVKEIKNNACYVLGDNKKKSTDSRHFGWIDQQLIIGKVIYPKNMYNS